MPWKPDWRSGWYLYRLENAFFKSIEFSRPPKVSDPVHVEVTAELRVHDGAFPSRLQVDLELSANEEQALKFRVELIGVFSLIEGEREPVSSTIPEFINERALHVLWPFAEQMTRLVTSQMGMDPLNIRTPYYFEFLPTEDPAAIAEKGKESQPPA